MLADTQQNLTVADRQQLFAMRLREVQAWLQERKIDYRVIGSVATSAYLDDGVTSSLNFSRKALNLHQRIPDIDLIIAKTDIPVVQEYQRELEQDPFFPITLEVLVPQCHIDWRPDEQASYLIHKELYVPAQSSVFNPVEQRFLGTHIVTVDAMTLFHIYVVSGGILRHKDWHGALGLARLVREGKTCHTEDEYRPFHQFLRLRAKQYPGYIQSRRVSEWLRNHIPSRIYYWGTHYGKVLQPLVFGAKA